MNDDWLDYGRVQQKRRTRASLLEAAGALIEEGHTPTVPQAASKAKVSRATAYRYFPSQESLLVEAAIDIAMPTPESLFGIDGEPTLSAENRAALAAWAIHKMCHESEPQIRMYLRTSMDRWFASDSEKPFLPIRQARRLRLIEAALQPIHEELSVERYETLVAALVMIIGIESMIALTDVLQLEPERAEKAKSWAVRSLVRTALAETTKNDPSATHLCLQP